MSCRALALSLLLSFAIMGPVRAEIRDEVVTLPVSIRSGTRAIEQTVTVTVVRDDARQKGPFLVLNHGRPGKESERKAYGRAVYREQARYFVQRGFVVLLPTRIGYGVTGGPDLESSGPSCSSRDYRAALAPAVAQVAATVDYARTLPYVDAGRGVILGQSMGGFTTIGAAAAHLPGVRIAINFAGGGGGDPDRRSAQPCRADLIADTFGDYGAATRIPTLWLYAPNDRYWGPDLPRQWFDTFKARGGTGEFAALPPFGTDGHASFVRNIVAWRPAVDAFLKKNGF